MLNQTAVYWAPGAAGADGNVTFAAGVEVSVRWQSKRELFVNALGQKETSQAVIYHDTADGGFVVNGRLYKGELADLSAPEQADPTLVAVAFQIKQIGESPSLDASQELGKTWL
jgi:hypothetical protein